MKKRLLIITLVFMTLLLAAMPVGAKMAPPLVPPPDGPQPDGTIRLTGEFTAWPVSIYEVYKYGGAAIEIDYYCSIDGVYRKVALGPANIYREGGHFYYWLDVLPDDPETDELEGPSAVGQKANFVYKWMRMYRAPAELGYKRDRAIKYTPDPNPEGPLPREVIQDLHLILDVD